MFSFNTSSFVRVIAPAMSFITTSALSLQRHRSRCDEERVVADSQIAVYLSSTAVASMRRHFKDNLKRPLDNLSSSCVVIKNNSDDADKYIYEPLFGEFAAFRLKGFITCSDAVVGVGKVSSYIGEIYDENHQVSILLSASKVLSKDRLAELLELPTALKAGKIAVSCKPDESGYAHWHGKLAKRSLFGVGYDYEECSYTSLPWHKQLVVGGQICCSEDVDNSGECRFDRRSVVPSETIHSKTLTTNSSNMLVNDGADTTKENTSECPICTFMKKGSCGSQFLEWKDCVDKAGADNKEEQNKCEEFKETLVLCMVKDDYYDIFVAKLQ